MDDRPQAMSRADRQAGYLRALQEKNRYKKLNQTKSREEQLNEERERGFQLNWAGANEQRAAREQESKDRRKSGGFPVFRPTQLSGGEDTDAAAGAPRRQWDAPAQHSRGSFGPIKAFRRGFGDLKPDFDGNETVQTRELQYDQDFEEEYELDDRSELEASSQVVEFLQSIGSSAEMDALRRSLECTLSPSKLKEARATSERLSHSPEGDVDDSKQNASSEQAERVAVEEQAPIAANLVHQIENLDVEQQMQLLSLLQQMTSKPSQPPKQQDRPGQAISEELDREVKSTPIRTEYPSQPTARPTSEPPMAASDHEGIVKTELSLPETSEQRQEEGLPMLGATATDSNFNLATGLIKVRIRMTSTWDGGKIGSLRRVLFYVLVDGQKYPMLVEQCQPRVQSGLEPYGTSADEARCLANLLQTSSLPREIWKGPVSRSAPLQILLDIPLSVVHSAISVGDSNVPYSVMVDIWNADDGHTGLAIRDVDVFSNSRCCWSGELPRRTTEELPCTVILAAEPDDADTGPAIPSQTQTQAPAHDHISSANPEVALGSTTDNTSGALSWIAELNQASRKPDTDGAPERPASGRTRSQRQKQRELSTFPFQGKEGNAVEAHTEKVLSKPPSTKALTLSIPDKPTPLADRATANSGSPLSKFMAVSEESASTKKSTVLGSEWGAHPSRAQGAVGRSSAKGEDDKLRSSLEALRKSDRQPRGRLAALGISFFSRKQAPVQERPAGVEHADSPNRGEVQEQRPDDQVQTSSECKRAHPVEEPVTGAIDSAQVSKEVEAAPISESSKKELLETRARKIGRVKRDVENALAGLAGVIGQLNTKKDRDEQLTPPKQTLTSVPSNQLEPEDVLEGSTVTIPELPSGRVFRMDILSTWGDPFYVGLNGIEMFDQHGQLVQLNDRSAQISAHPSDINVLPEYDGDPRVKENLFDGVNYTCDDLHMWLAPFNEGESHFVTVDFRDTTTLSMIRVWNYNKSRTHAYRGVRVVRLSLDDSIIFEGEILLASGVLDGVEHCSEVILFTLDSNVMSTIAKFDEQQGYLSEDRTTHWKETAFTALTTTRPATAADNADEKRQQQQQQQQSESANGRMWKRKARTDRPRMTYEEAVSGKTPSHRPLTAARASSAFRDSSNFASLAPLPDTIDDLLNMEHSPEEQLHPDSASPQQQFATTTCSTIELLIRSTWSDADYVGLTGIQVLGVGGEVIPVRSDHITTTPKDLSAIGVRNDPRVSANLVDNVNDTTDDTHMWLAPFNAGEDHIVRIRLSKATDVAGLRIWNYNKSPEDSYRGAKDTEIRLDGRSSGMCVLRISPGMDGLSLGQLVLFDELSTPTSSTTERSKNYVSPSVRQDYEAQMLPSGLLWQFILHSTWGDPYYIGLDGLELFDSTGAKIALETSQLSALPHSIRDINQSDTRVPANLVEGSAPWLAPLANSMTAEEHKSAVIRCGQEYAAMTHSHPPPVHERLTTAAENMLFIGLSRPETLSFIRISNYSKTPERGVKEFSVRCDGKLVFRGTIAKVAADGQPPRGQAILFTNDPRIVQKEKGTVAYCGRTEQDVLCIDERQVRVRSQAMYSKPDPTAPGVQTDIAMRPETALR